MTKLKNFFFDLDGVLVNACDWHYEALNNSLHEFCGFIIDRKSHETKFNGLPTRKKLSLLQIDSKLHDDIVIFKNNKFDEIVSQNCQVDESKVELLEFLRSKNCKIACITNSIRHTADTILKKMAIHHYFDLIVSNEDVTINKPDPHPYNYALENLKCDPKLTIAVEDSIVGIQSAAMSKVAILWKVSDATFVNLENLISIIGG